MENHLCIGYIIDIERFFCPSQIAFYGKNVRLAVSYFVGDHIASVISLIVSRDLM